MSCIICKRKLQRDNGYLEGHYNFEEGMVCIFCKKEYETRYRQAVLKKELDEKNRRHNNNSETKKEV